MVVLRSILMHLGSDTTFKDRVVILGQHTVYVFHSNVITPREGTEEVVTLYSEEGLLLSRLVRNDVNMVLLNVPNDLGHILIQCVDRSRGRPFT